MKVIDLTSYRKRNQIRALEKRISEYYLSSKSGSFREIKTYFKEWLKATKNDGENL
jgi:hypothetical protein